MRFPTMTAAMAVCSLLWGCEKNDEAPEPEATPKVSDQEIGRTTPADEGEADQMTGPMMGRLRSACPMAIDGVEVEVSDIDKGVALTFKSDAGDRDELRQRTEHLAQMYEMHDGRPMMWHHMRGAGKGRGMGMGMGRGPMPAADAEVTETNGGVRLELTPRDPSQLQRLREHARWHQQRMQSGACWMWSGDQQMEEQK